MFLPVGLFFLLALTTSLVNGGKEISVLKMTDAKPYEELKCPESCGRGLVAGLTLASQALKNIPFPLTLPVDFCEKCVVENLADFNFEHKCFMNAEQNIFDHHLRIKFPRLAVNCECDFSNNPSATAEKINKGKISEGSCGRNNDKSNPGCKPLTCDGSQGGEGQSRVEIAVDLRNVTMTTILRVDKLQNPATKITDAFLLRLAITPSTDSPISYKGPEEFGEAGKCLAKNTEGLLCHMLANLPVPFLNCMDPTSNLQFVGGILYTVVNC